MRGNKKAPLLLLAVVAGACAQSTAAAPPTRVGGVDFSGLFDGYYSFNDNHPDSGFNNAYNFDDRTNQVDLNLMRLTVNRDPAPIGFHVDAGLGRAMELMHTPVPDPAGFRFIEQAYISVKPKQWKGVEVDLGDFTTWAGAEVVESKDNWNYSRSLLFALAIPYYHFGVRASVPLGSSVTAGVQVVNGWNEIVDGYGNNMQTVGLTGALTRKKFTWTNNYYTGPQYTALTRGDRRLYDTTLLLTPAERFSAYVNFDYGRQHGTTSGLAHWQGIAAAARYQATKRIAISPRFEYYDDASGFTTGTRQKLHEFTVTGEYKIFDGVLTRLELRHDGSDMPFFDHASQSAASRTQTTATIALIAFFPAGH